MCLYQFLNFYSAVLFSLTEMKKMRRVQHVCHSAVSERERMKLYVTKQEQSERITAHQMLFLPTPLHTQTHICHW